MAQICWAKCGAFMFIKWWRIFQPNISEISILMFSSELITGQLAEYLKRIQGDKNRWKTTLTSHSSSSCTCITDSSEAFTISLLPSPTKTPPSMPLASFYKCCCIFWGLRKEHRTSQHLPQSIPYIQVIIFGLFSTTFTTIPTDLSL